MEFKPNKEKSEAMLQALFFGACVLFKLNCYLEYRQRSKPGQRGCRFDAVVHKDGKIIAIVEIKAPKTPGKYNWNRTKQSQKYRSYGVPVYLITCLEEVNTTAAAIFKGVGG